MGKAGAVTHRPKLISTKFRVPLGDKTHHVMRPRLLEQLNAGTGRKLTLIHAPAGCGKTTLATQWREELLKLGATVAWLSLDRNDSDLERCLSYIVEAIRLVEPSIAVDLVSLLEANSEGAAGFVLTDLVSEFENYTGEFFLVLDDWHLIKSEKIHDALLFLCAHSPPNFHLIVTCRSQPALPLAKLRLEAQLTEIKESDLRFDETECAAFLTSADKLGLRADQVQTLWKTTEGWIGALQLALISLRTSENRDQLIAKFSGKHHSIADYLTENVLNSLPGDTLEFLLKTSILDRLSGRLCSAVSGRPDAQIFLESLEKQDLFIRPLDDERVWFRYHHLFASYLQRRLERDYPEQVASLHLAASVWFAENGQTGEAISHALSAGDNERAIDLVEKDAMWLVEHSYMGTLLGWVNKLPKAPLRGRFALQLAIAWANCLIHRPADARSALVGVELALSGIDAAEARESIGEARVVQACIDIYEDRIEGIEATLRACLDDSIAYRPWIIAVAANVLTYVLIHSFRFEEAMRLQVWARPFHERTQGPFSAVYGRCFFGMAQLAIGQLAAAADSFQQTLSLARETAGRHSHAAQLAGALLGQVLYESNALHDAELLLEESRELGVEGGVADFSLATYITLSKIKVQQVDFADAHTILDEGASNAEQLSIERLSKAVAAERVRVLLAQGNITAANRMLGVFAAGGGVAAAALPDGITTQISEMGQMAQARVLCAQGQAQTAVALLTPLLEKAVANQRKYFEVCLRVQLAIALELAGLQENADEMLKVAVISGFPHGVVRTFLDEDSRLIVSLGRLRDKCRRAPGDCPTHLIDWLDDLIAASRGSHCESPANPPLKGTAAKKSSDAKSVEALKEREVDILRMLDQGRANKEIARSLGIGVDTVKWYLKAIFAKLGVARRAHAIAEARRLRIFS